MPQTGSLLQDGDLLAAVDLGSNSFHMVVARYLLGQLRVVDRLREPVRMAAGLTAEGGLSADARDRALHCLSRFGERLRNVPPSRVRAIATNTVRQLRHPQAFLLPAETALGHAIEVVSGREEARLIYLGVAHGLPPKPDRRLVIDIGGGSTESIIGEGFEPLERESLQMGCVATTRRFFADGRISRRRWRDALTEISAEFQQFAATYRSRGWRDVIGSSGTIKAIGKIGSALKLGRGEITPSTIVGIREALLEFDQLERIRLPGLSDERQPVIAGGLLVLEACFGELGIDSMAISATAMREGVLYDLLGRAQHRDPRDGSIDALARRYGVDQAHADRVEATVMTLFEQCAGAWEIEDEHRMRLAWAARIHEIGVAIAHSQHHVHGAYLVEHSDIAGFSTQEQRSVAALLRCQRRSLSKSALASIPQRSFATVLRCIVLLRLSVLLHRSHEDETLPPLHVEAGSDRLRLDLPQTWLQAHPLTRADLETERELLQEIGIELELPQR